MTRKIEDAMIHAIREGHEFHQGNTTVHHGLVQANQYAVEVRLHGNLIAKRNSGTGWQFNLCGYNTNLTRSRLSAIAREFVPNCRGIGTKQGQASIRYRGGEVRKVADSGWFTP